MGQQQTTTNSKQVNNPASLIAASFNNDIEMCQQILLHKENININEKDKMGRTALVVASMKGYKSICELLIQHGINIHLKDNQGYTALAHALKNNDLQLYKLIFNSGGNMEINELRARLCKKGYAQACQNKDYGLCHQILNDNVKFNVNESGKMGWKPIFASIYSGSLKLCQRIIEKGGDMTITHGTSGYDPLQYAVINGNKTICKYLIMKGANRQFVNRYGESTDFLNGIFKQY